MLKGFWKRYKGASIRYKIKELFWELRYAWQRAWRGYDFTDVFNLNNNFTDKIILVLKDFKENNVGLFANLDNDGEYHMSDDRYWLTEEETNKIIDDMIYCFENSDANKMIEPLYGELDEKTLEFKNKPTIEQIEEYSRIAKDNRQKGLVLFTKYFDCLWY